MKYLGQTRCRVIKTRGDRSLVDLKFYSDLLEKTIIYRDWVLSSTITDEPIIFSKEKEN